MKKKTEKPIKRRMKKKEMGLEEINSYDAYMDKRFICIQCHGECSLTDLYCRWCGARFPEDLNAKVVEKLSKRQCE